ncbi:hypothetical protein ILUMI_04606 [Ignelater luminosus]|uniref:Mediator of RNA polymerase II transcription subunit 30 n=1 Tax=Ignelater luminosus TaxID=2038154 RepID=A0A8K0DDJ5_IGNLU|nr:hypothetical protein ILUMI_04606 [Ignelater luminosus]
MSGPAHHFLPGLTNVQTNTARSQFGAGPLQTQMGNGMQNQLNNQLGNQMPLPLANQINSQLNNQMVSQMSTSINNQMNSSSMTSSNQMLGPLTQQYNMGNNTPMTHQPANSLQIQQNPMTTLQHHSIQQQVLQQPPNVAPTPPAPTHAQQSKEFNTASLCRIGQETVQDIVSRTQEVFQTLKAIQPPNGTPQGTGTSNEKKAKVQELLRTIRVLFKRLRLIYEKCNENCQLQGMEYTHIESLIPFKDEIDPKHDEKKNSESYRLACEESKEVMEQVILKNRQLKEVIDHLRRIIWEINTMLTMRRS